MSEINVLIADDQLLFAESLKMVLEQRSDDIKKVSVVNDGESAVKSADSEKPDVILMDIHMPVLNGVEALKIIKSKFPGIKIIILTMDSDDDFISEALKHGAEGYMLKDIPPNELILAIKAVYEGSVLISPLIAQKLINQLQTREKSVESRTAPHWLNNLSKREREVLALISEGYDNAEIAKKLFIAEQTVKNYVSVIYTKIGTHNRYNAMRMGKDALI